LSYRDYRLDYRRPGRSAIACVIHIVYIFVRIVYYYMIFFSIDNGRGEEIVRYLGTLHTCHVVLRDFGHFK